MPSHPHAERKGEVEPLPISAEELEDARAILRRGGDLQEAAEWIGCTRATLDLELWRQSPCGRREAA